MIKYESLQSAITAVFGSGVHVESRSAVSGGDINEAHALKLSDGSVVFMKSNHAKNIDFFRAETEGLLALAKTNAIRMPEILAYGTDGNRAFLLLKYIRSGAGKTLFWENFGHNLAGVHRSAADEFVKGGRFGFISDNYIGAGNQKNTACEKWVDFYRDCRLKPQFERASHYFGADEKRKINGLLEHLGDFLTEPKCPSLLHGDLWSGNFMTGEDGEAWLIDPAVYVGHAEADLAMTELFGGFRPRFYAAYREANPFDSGYEDRKELYQLYHLLNHLNLFGGSWFSSVMKILRKYGAY